MIRILLLIILCPIFVFSQEDSETESDSNFEAKPEFYFYLHNQNNFGDNFLSEANKPQFLGIGLQINVLKAYNFKLGLGGEFIQYNVTNETLAGNIEQSFYYAIFSKIQYEIDFGKKWAIEPLIGIGRTRIQQKTGSKNFDDFYGTAFYLGSNLLYKLSDHIAVYLGANYNYTRFNVKTSAAFEDFFRNANQVQFQVGLIFSVGNN